ncbi:MAG: hypothetical protein MI867_27985, partial [Pseudomonadales bacterium]|nr:hypothetical protein [Pseudomonadales bacterium]
MAEAASIRRSNVSVRSMSPKTQAVVNRLTQQVAIPLVGVLVFLVMWSFAASNIDTSLGKFPGPAAVWEQFGNLYSEHVSEREKEAAFYERQEKRNADRVAQDPDYVPRIRKYTGKETFIDQIGTSLVTVMSGFFVAAFIAVPLGIAIGL